MRAWATRGPWRFAIVFTAGACFVAFCLPIWKTMYVGEWEATAEPRPFWVMLTELPQSVGRASPAWLWDRFYGPVLAQLAVLLAASLCVGRWVGGRAQAVGPRSAARNRASRS